MYSVAGCGTTAPEMRSKLDYSGGSPVPSLDAVGCALARVRVPIDIAELPIDSAAEGLALKQSGHHKILKFFKLRKRTSGCVSQEALQPALTTFRFQDQGSKRFASVKDVDLERYKYDSDEQSTGSVTERRRRNSCSTSASTSTRSSASAQSFRSMTTARTSFILGSGHQSSAQLMANILISISHLDEDDVGPSESEDDHSALNGPHESAWHQPRDEILAGGATVISSVKHSSSGRNTPRTGRCSLDMHLTSPGPSRRFGKLDLSRIEKIK